VDCQKEIEKKKVYDRTMGDTDYGLAVGCRADLVVVAGDTPTEAVINLPPRTYVFKAGRLVAADGQCLV